MGTNILKAILLVYGVGCIWAHAQIANRGEQASNTTFAMHWGTAGSALVLGALCGYQAGKHENPYS